MRKQNKDIFKESEEFLLMGVMLYCNSHGVWCYALVACVTYTIEIYWIENSYILAIYVNFVSPISVSWPNNRNQITFHVKPLCETFFKFMQIIYDLHTKFSIIFVFYFNFFFAPRPFCLNERFPISRCLIQA